MNFSFFKKKSGNTLHTVAFYNLENLFDTIDDPYTLDDDYTPNGSRKWTPRRYQKKLAKLAETIVKIGHVSAGIPPVLVGVAEVENETVVQDLLATDPLNGYNYHYVHYDSPDERGIDNALLYNRDNFEVISSEAIPLLVYSLTGQRDTTRDILYVHGILNGEEVHIFVNHWPSRRNGEVETGYKRIAAAKTINEYMVRIEESIENPNYIVMGDFNDGPSSTSIQTLMSRNNLHNPMETLRSPDRGSANYRKAWSLFDQIIVSHTFFNYEKGTHSFCEANIFDETFLTEFKGKYKGNPHRTYVGRRYMGGFSDHFPVYIQFKYNS
ncbi:endonuclease [Arenibacter sp. TNZ]|jgi:endonuclease/exonuclease/phosphatase family metal-dependent hydrolase|uniref:endonuclease/exonuclease/phosphatase family protein n=1 Tax=Arenibacter TaxID=178469 RepID=UPI000CD40A2E|nr:MULTISPECIES: endonuclease/exonuclease/phosphatase family protein [Arenibacter]MCM4172152.1 endonuclease [Arenibacter sp. TNZ]